MCVVHLVHSTYICIFFYKYLSIYSYSEMCDGHIIIKVIYDTSLLKKEVEGCIGSFVKTFGQARICSYAQDYI
ncbi:hypothetical protein QVD17_17763 [Tagetes erecta]|uniref:Uncharacterized protein n=1 Tax=Tagetes erecta TaxID=13708 RepID=A0AAD8KTV0_TARER|nr:hypothetical protein QVD17_17763 [Tagetes erecta]